MGQRGLPIGLDRLPRGSCPLQAYLAQPLAKRLCVVGAPFVFKLLWMYCARFTAAFANSPSGTAAAQFDLLRANIPKNFRSVASFCGFSSAAEGRVYDACPCSTNGIRTIQA